MTLQERFEQYKKDERHLNTAETRYWMAQYKLLCEDLLASQQVSPDGRVSHSVQVAQEPVAYLQTDSIGERFLCFSKPNEPEHTIQPLYAAPVKAQGIPPLRVGSSLRSGVPDGLLQWAVDQWHREVANRPLVNRHRRTLDDTWRQVIQHAGGDPDLLVGQSHDTLLAAAHERSEKLKQEGK